MRTRLTFFTALSCVAWLSISLATAQENRLTLQQAIDYALENNPDFLTMQDRIGQAEAQLGMALSNFFPQFKARLSYEHSDNPSRAFGMIIAQRRLSFSGTDFNHPGGIDNYRPEVTGSYSLFRGGQDYYATRAAELGVEAAALEQSATRNRLIQLVSSAFYSYLAAEETYKVAQRSIEAVSSELKQSKDRYDAGSALKSDVLSLQVRLAEAQDIEIQSANGIELIRSSLKTLLGMDFKQPLQISSQNNWDLPNQQRSLSVLLDQAMAQRPEIAAANKKLEIAESQLRAAQGAHLPRADAYVSYGSDSKNLDFNTNRDNVTAGVMVEMDIFSGFRDSENVKKSQHQYAAAEKSVRKTRLQIENEVNSAQLRLNEAMARMNVTQASVNAAEEALRMVRQQRDAGVVTVTRYIEAEVARDNALARNIASRFDALQAEAQLNQAVGHWK
jgi:outer membrane protein